VAKALSIRRGHTVDEPDEHEAALRLQQENNDLRGAMAHLEGVVAKLETTLTRAEATEAELRDELHATDEARVALEDLLASARTSRIFRLTGLPRALTPPAETTAPGEPGERPS
jgi:predicted  nucleic acid-binding Zn-ribbon protein